MTRDRPLPTPGPIDGPPKPSTRMPITYYKRFRMEADLDSATAPAVLPEGFSWVAWQEGLIDLHAEVKYLAFRDEIDANVFPCLGDRHGCQRLMREIRRKPGFLPGACW